MENTGKKYEEVMNSSEEQKKAELEAVFLESLYVAMGFAGQEKNQEYLRMYLPMLVLAEEDGAFFFHMQEKSKDGIIELCHVWSDKIPYPYEESATEAQKKGAVADLLERKASEIISNHSYIVSQYGITYSFYVPAFLQDTTKELKFPMIFAVFQGWPLNASASIIYENCIDAGVYLQRTENYVVTGPAGLSDTFFYFHTVFCPALTKHTYLILAENVTKENAIMEFGAVPCKECASNKE